MEVTIMEMNHSMKKGIATSYNFQYIKQHSCKPREFVHFMKYRCICTRLQYLQCVCNGDTSVMHQAIDTFLDATVSLILEHSP